MPPALPVDTYYYLRRIEELASKLQDLDSEEAVANYLGVTAKYGVNSPEWNRTQVGNGVIAAMTEFQKYSGCLDPKIHGYRGEKEFLTLPQSLEKFRPVPSAAPGSYEDSVWIDQRTRNCSNRRDAQAKDIPLEFTSSYNKMNLKGPTRPDLVLAKVELACKHDIDKAFSVAQKSGAKWEGKPVRERMMVLSEAVGKMRDRRAELDESLMLSPGKAVLEADEEVNESMDFLNLARLHMGQLAGRESLEFKTEGNGVATVICPKNFPQAIPLAHIVARLLAGYRVIVKPSGGPGEETFLATYEMMQCLWEAGVPKEALIFLPCDNKNAAYLAKKSKRIGFTGSTATAAKIHEANPDAEMIAETGGRNFIIVDGSSDLKAVATEVLKSMCGFAGQKCSKPIGVILTKDVNLEKFKRHILGQLKEMLIDNALVRHVDVTPLSREYPADHPFYRKVMECLPGEEWLTGEDEIMREVSAQPSKMGDPGIRFIKDAANFDFTKIEEIFGPILSIAQIDGGIEEAVELVNSTAGSLTGSLFSEDRESIFYALQNWKTGNLYIRRGNTGAKAHQGFGDGTGDAHRGAHGAKTGTIEWQIMNSSIRRRKGKYAKYDKKEIEGYCEENPEESFDDSGMIGVLSELEYELGRSWDFGGEFREQLVASMHAGWSCLYEHSRHFAQRRVAPYQTKGQYDWIESHKIGRVMLRVSKGDNFEEILGKIFATVAAGNALRISVDPVMRGIIENAELFIGGKLEDIFPNVNLVYEQDGGVANFILKNAVRKDDNSQKVRCLLYSSKNKVQDEVFQNAAQEALHIDARPVTGDGMVDMVTQFRQQSYCWVYHVAGDTAYEDMIAKNHTEQVPYARAA